MASAATLGADATGAINGASLSNDTTGSTGSDGDGDDGDLKTTASVAWQRAEVGEWVSRPSTLAPGSRTRTAAAVAPAACSWRVRRAAGLRWVRQRMPPTTGNAAVISPVVQAKKRGSETALSSGEERTSKPATLAVLAARGLTAADDNAASATPLDASLPIVTCTHDGRERSADSGAYSGDFLIRSEHGLAADPAT